MISRLKRRGIKTHQIEAAFAAVALAAVAFFSGNAWKEWLGAAAVFLSFKHSQITDRLRESQEQMDTPAVKCHEASIWYLFSKELLWTVYFILSHAWSALVGVALFGGYPLWRKFYRKKLKPLKRA